MQQPNKRRRTSGQFSPTNRPLEEVDVNQARKVNDLRLKSRFESIFEKYGKDFSAVGDEIDLATGEIIVNNGHLGEMQGEQDTGRGLWDDFHPEDSDSGDNAQDTDPPAAVEATDNPTLAEPTGNARNDTLTGCDENGTDLPRPLDQSANCDCAPGKAHSCHAPNEEPITPCPTDMGVQNWLSGYNGSNQPVPNVDTGKSLEVEYHSENQKNSEVVDSLWAAPEIDPPFPTAQEPEIDLSKYGGERTPSPQNAGSLWMIPGMSRQRTINGTNRKSRVHRAAKKKEALQPCYDGSDSDDPIQSGSKSIPPEISSSSNNALTVHSPPSVDLFPFTEDEVHSEPREEPTHKQTESIIQRPLVITVAENIIGDVPQTPKSDVFVTTINSTEDLSPTKEGHEGMEEANDGPATPTKEPATNTTPENLNPHEVKIVVTLRMVKRKAWREVYSAIPLRPSTQLRRWYYIHCNRMACNPPISSRPWLAAEKEKLTLFEPNPPHFWEEILSAFEDRNIEELQYEWIKTCAGEKTWQHWKPARHGEKSHKKPHDKKADSILLLDTVESHDPSSPKPPSMTPRDPAHQKEAGVSHETTDLDNDRAESPDPLLTAFEDAWVGSGLSTLQINTPPKRIRSPKKQPFQNARNSPLAFKLRPARN